jgi:hypothetical protein
MDLLCKEYGLTLDWRSLRDHLYSAVRLLHVCDDAAATVDPARGVERIWIGAFSWLSEDYPTFLESIPCPNQSTIAGSRQADLLSLITNRERLMIHPLQAG